MLRACTLVFLAAMIADADAAPPESVRLVVAAADDSCVDEPMLRASIVGRLGRDPFRDDAGELVRVAVERDLRARIARFDAGGVLRGERELAATTCDELAETLSLSIAIAIDPQFAQREQPQATLAIAVVPAPPPRSVNVSAWGAIGVVGGVGTQPAPSAGLTLQLGARRGRIALALEGRIDRSQTADGVRASAALASVLVCGAFAGPRVCAIAGVERIAGEGVGLVQPRADSTGLAVAGARLAWPIAASRVRIVPHFDVLVPLGRTSFVRDGMTVWEAQRVHVALGAAVELDFL